LKTKQEYITYWTTQAQDDWEAVDVLFSGKKFLQSLFFAHLCVEKICKALWILSNESNIPPKTHNLIYLLSQTTLQPTDAQSEFLLELNRFQLEGRYPEYISQMHLLGNKSFTQNTIEKTNEIRIWLLSKLQ